MRKERPKGCIFFVAIAIDHAIRRRERRVVAFSNNFNKETILKKKREKKWRVKMFEKDSSIFSR